MAEDLKKMWGIFSLTEEKDVDVEIQKTALVGLGDRGKTCLVGQLLSDNFVGKENIKSTILRWWKLQGMVTFNVLGNNLFLMDFEHYWEKSQVLEGQPWGFERIIFSLEDFDGVSPLEMIEFEKVPFWVRMYKLPLACMSVEIGNQIGSTVGHVEEVEIDEDGVGWGKFLRVRIRIDVTKPLARGWRLKI